ncbi:MAG: CotH kinase family protein [Bacteroidetes bacterium]|nr:CotH kinase family protein [Bacteroidota bacterium]
MKARQLQTWCTKNPIPKKINYRMNHLEYFIKKSDLIIKFIIPLSLSLSLGPAGHAQVTFTSSVLPIVVIDTHSQDIPDDPKIPASMGIIYNGHGATNNITDPYNDFNGNIGIELRGSSSQSFPKKQYGIEVRDTTGNAIDASLLGMPAKDDWVLYAAYDDKTLVRDALAYTMGRAQGRYASRVQFCELVLNGVYQGVYVLLEKIKRDKYRVNISKLKTSDNSGDAITGGYIIKIDKTTGGGGAGWSSSYPPLHRAYNQVVYFQYSYPKDVDITAQQQAYIKQYMDAFENTLSSSGFRDTVSGYQKYIDIDSFVDFYLMMEATKNPDGYRLSTFMYKDKDSKGGKLSMGPIWDFNEGFGNVDYCTKGNPEGFVTAYNTICPTDYFLIPFWWDKLFQDLAFNNKVAKRWAALRNGPFQTQKILHYVDSVASVLTTSSAQQRNFTQWPILGQYVWPNYYVGNSYTSEITWLKNWITQRMNWLDANIQTITAVQNRESQFEVLGFPNPVTSKFTIQYTIPEPADVTLEIYTALGSKIESSLIHHAVAGAYGWEYSSYLSPGTYIVRVQMNQEVRHLRLTKQ